MLTAPTNGRIDYTTDATAPHDFGTVATYVCDPGYGRVGDLTRTCGGSTGVWSGSAATCARKKTYLCLCLAMQIEEKLNYKHAVLYIVTL